MIKHILTLVWNKRKQTSLQVMELSVFFFVVFVVFCFVIKSLEQQFSPMGFETETVYNLQFPWGGFTDNDQKSYEEILEFHQLIRRELLSDPEVEMISFHNGTIPYSRSSFNSYLERGGSSVDFNLIQADENLLKVIGLQVEEGDPIGGNEIGEKGYWVNSYLAEEAFGGTSPVDSLIQVGSSDDLPIIGVFEHMKIQGEFSYEEGVIIKLLGMGNPDIAAIAMRVNCANKAVFLERITEKMEAVFEGEQFQVEHLEDSRIENSRLAWIMVYALVVMLIFLCLNVVFGLVGSQSQVVLKRKAEIGLRMALGASEKEILTLFMAESILTVFIALLIGLVFAVQFPILKVFDLELNVYIYAMAIASILILLLSIFSSIYPSLKASRTVVAACLHEN